MKFTFACKKVALNDSIKEYAEKKISKLDRYFPEEADAFVTFAVEKKNRCVVELTIRAANGTLFRAQEEDPDGDMRGAIDEAVAFIDRRIRKNKTRLARNLRPDALTSNIPAEFDVVEEPEYHLVRTKHFAVKPMSTEEAILQMNLLDHSFFVFRNSDDDSLSIVYQRKNGVIVLLLPAKTPCLRIQKTPLFSGKPVFAFKQRGSGSLLFLCARKRLARRLCGRLALAQFSRQRIRVGHAETAQCRL